MRSNPTEATRQRVTESATSRAGAFTLIEVLVATVILSMVVVFLGSMFSTVEGSLTELTSSARKRQDARTVLANISQELRQAVVPVTFSFQGADPRARQAQLYINPAGL